MRFPRSSGVSTAIRRHLEGVSGATRSKRAPRSDSLRPRGGGCAVNRAQERQERRRTRCGETHRRVPAATDAVGGSPATNTRACAATLGWGLPFSVPDRWSGLRHVTGPIAGVVFSGRTPPAVPGTGSVRGCEGGGNGQLELRKQ